MSWAFQYNFNGQIVMHFKSLSQRFKMDNLYDFHYMKWRLKYMFNYRNKIKHFFQHHYADLLIIWREPILRSHPQKWSKERKEYNNIRINQNWNSFSFRWKRNSVSKFHKNGQNSEFVEFNFTWKPLLPMCCMLS